jgi:hypothetical protein
MPQFVRLELWSKLQCQSGTKLAVLYPDDLQAAGDVRAIDDTESMTFAFTRFDDSGAVRPIVTKLVARAIATVVWDDGTFDEWRVSLIDDGHGLNAPITVTANPLLQDLAEGADSATGFGLVSASALCLRNYDFSVSGNTATQLWDAYVIPNSPSWVSRGTIDPTTIIPTVTWSRLTPLALASQIRDQLRAMDISCELQLRRNGVTDYKLDLVTQIGSGASVPLFHPRSNLGTIKRRTDATQQATRVFVTGDTDPSGQPGIPGRGRWKVTNVDGANKKLTLADPNGGPGPIGMDGQWVSAYIARALTGRTFAIQASSSSAQTVTLLDVSTFAANETVEIRMTEPGNNTRAMNSPNTRYAISSIASNVLTLSGNPIAVNNAFVDWYVKVWTLSSGGSVVGTPQRVSATVASSDTVTITSAAGFNNTMFVEFIQLDGAGEMPNFLDHATAILAPPTGYGMKAADLGVSNVVGATNLMPNSWLRSWANPSNPPDGYSLTTPASGSQNTNPSFTRYGGLSWLIDFTTAGTFQSPRFDQLVAAGNTKVSVRLQIYFSAFSAAGTLNTAFGLTLTLIALDQTGAFAFQLATFEVKPVDTNDTSFPNKIAAGAWATIELVAFDIPMYRTPFGMAIQLSAGGGSASPSCTAYVDALEVYAFNANPASVLEYGDAVALHQAGNSYLALNGTPPTAWEMTIADLERADPTGFARSKITLGGNVRGFDPELGIDTTIRLLRLERDFLRPKQSIVGLASLPALLLRLIQTNTG